jgi:alpha-mannosidase
MQSLQLMVDNSDLDPEDVAVTVFNPSPFERSDVMTAYLDLPADCGYEYFSMQEATTGEKISIQPFSSNEAHPVLRHLNDATVEMPSEKVGLHFEAGGVPGLGYRTFLVRREGTQVVPEPSMVKGLYLMENENLSVEVEGDGTLTVTDKASGQSYGGLNLFTDDGEAGMAWRHLPPAFDQVITSRGALNSVSVAESGSLVSSFQVEFSMKIPLELDEAGSDDVKRLDGNGNVARRSDEERELRISSLVTLRKGARHVEVTTRFDNQCRDHRLRVAFPTGITSETCHAESAFDVVEREIERGPDNPWASPWNVTSPQQRFVDIGDGTRGLAILNEGLREYEVSEDPSRTISLTLMRAYEIALSTVAWRWERHPEMGLSQCPGAHEFRYAIMPHDGSWQDAGVLAEAEKLNLPMTTAQVGKHGGSMPKSWGFLEVSPADVALSIAKRAEKDGDIILRVYNPTTRSVEARLSIALPVKTAVLTDMEENPVEEARVDGKTVTVPLPPKKVATVKVTLV